MSQTAQPGFAAVAAATPKPPPPPAIADDGTKPTTRSSLLERREVVVSLLRSLRATLATHGQTAIGDNKDGGDDYAAQASKFAALRGLVPHTTKGMRSKAAELAAHRTASRKRRRGKGAPSDPRLSSFLPPTKDATAVRQTKALSFRGREKAREMSRHFAASAPLSGMT